MPIYSIWQYWPGNTKNHAKLLKLKCIVPLLVNSVLCVILKANITGRNATWKQTIHSLCPADSLMLFYFPSLIHFSVCISVLHFQSVSTGAGCLLRRQDTSDRSITGSDSLLCCPPHWQGGSLEIIVGVWQPSAPWHLSACCSPCATTGVKGVRCTSVHQGRWSDFPGRWSSRRTGRLRVMVQHKRVDDIEGVWGFTGCCLATTLAFTFSMERSSSVDLCSWPNYGETPSELDFFNSTTCRVWKIKRPVVSSRDATSSDLGAIL